MAGLLGEVRDDLRHGNGESVRIEHFDFRSAACRHGAEANGGDEGEKAKAVKHEVLPIFLVSLACGIGCF
jgi:hypothetical protein